MKSLEKTVSSKVVTHENIIQSTCAYIHILNDDHHTGTLDEKSIEVLGLLSCLENIFCHSLKDAVKWRKDWRVWHWVAEACEPIPHTCVPLVKSMDNLQNGLAKLRAFLRLALQSKRLHLYLDRSFNSVELITKFYHSNTVLLSNQLRRVTNAAVELQYLDFCFDIRAEDLNFPGVRQIDYASIIDITPGNKQLIFGETSGLRSSSEVCKQCQELAFKAITTNAQKKYLEDVLRDTNRQLIDYRESVSSLLHDNKILRTALDQIQTKFVLLHEEYSRRLQQSGTHSLDLPCAIPSSEVTSEVRHHLKRSPLNSRRRFPLVAASSSVTAHEVTEDLTAQDLSLLLPSREGSPRGSRGLAAASATFTRPVAPRDAVPVHLHLDYSAREATEDLDPVDLLQPADTTPSSTNIATPFSFPPIYRSYSSADATGTAMPMALRVECPTTATGAPSLQPADSSLVGEQVVDEGLMKYRLPNAVGTSPDPTELPFDLNRWVVTVKPTDTNYRARFSLPKTAPTNSSMMRQPQLDLMSELQQTDTSFPITGLTNNSSDGHAALSTSSQVSEIALDMTTEVADDNDGLLTNEEGDGQGYCGVDDDGVPAATTSSSRNTVLTSTSTIKPATSCVSLASPLSNNEAEAINALSATALHRSASELFVSKSHFYTLMDSSMLDSAASGGDLIGAENYWMHCRPLCTPFSTSSPRRNHNLHLQRAGDSSILQLSSPPAQMCPDQSSSSA